MQRQGNGSAAAPNGRDQLVIDASSRVEEDTPLLAKADDGDSSTAAGSVPYDWQTDFEGLPWYRKPSVSIPLMDSTTLTNAP